MSNVEDCPGKDEGIKLLVYATCCHGGGCFLGFLIVFNKAFSKVLGQPVA